MVKNDKQKTKDHSSSKSLSAGKLSLPLQWQVLHYIGVEKAPPPPEKLGKFTRGNIYEDETIKLLSQTGQTLSQLYTVYRGCIGYLDVLYEGFPIEIKTIDSNEWKRLKAPKRGHVLQASCYALALENDEFGVLYVKPDTFETKLFTEKTADWKPHVDTAIDIYEKAIAEYNVSGLVPGFEPREFWHGAISANHYPQYASFTMPFKL